MIVSVEKLVCDGCGYEGYECGEITEEILGEMIKENGWGTIDGKHFCEDCMKRVKNIKPAAD